MTFDRPASRPVPDSLLLGQGSWTPELLKGLLTDRLTDSLASWLSCRLRVGMPAGSLMAQLSINIDSLI